MNYLAHAYLSFGRPKILVGNMIGDFVHGDQSAKYEPEVWMGIMLHRHIDSYTDQNSEVLTTKKIFSPYVRRYDGAFLDISFDYMLANSVRYEPDEGWQYFTERCYAVIKDNWNILPPSSHRLFSYMEQENWLYNYRLESQIEKSFRGLVRRAKYLEDDINPFPAFLENKKMLQMNFEAFFPHLLESCIEKLAIFCK